MQNYSTAMSQHQYSVGGRWKSLNALAILIWLFVGSIAFVHAHPSQPVTSTGNTVASKKPSTEDTITIDERDLSPDILATSVPVSSIYHPANKDQSLKHNGLLLRSSTSNVSGIGGYPIFALPIMSSDLAEILSKTQADLQTRKSDLSTSSYSINTTDWSFLVLMDNTTLPFAAIRSVVMRFLKLSPTTKEPQDIVSTRVGVILNDSTPIADIVILPYRPVGNTSDIPFTNFGNHSLSTSHPNEVFQITPYGSTCTHQVVNETTALALYSDHDPTTKQNNLRTRDIQGEIVAPLGQTIYQIGYRLWRDPVYGIPVLVKAWALHAIILVALQLATFELFKELRDPIPPSEVGTMPSPFKLGGLNQTSTLDTGYYPVGRLMARFVIQNMENFRPVEPLGMMLKVNFEFLKAMAQRVKDMNPQDDVFAIEGEVYKPNDTDSENSTKEEGVRQTVAKWQLSVRDLGEL